VQVRRCVLDTTYGAINRVTGARDKVRNRYVPAGFKEQLPSSDREAQSKSGGWRMQGCSWRVFGAAEETLTCSQSVSIAVSIISLLMTSVPVAGTSPVGRGKRKARCAHRQEPQHLLRVTLCGVEVMKASAITRDEVRYRNCIPGARSQNLVWMCARKKKPILA
jgi:hypothetical protein